MLQMLSAIKNEPRSYEDYDLSKVEAIDSANNACLFRTFAMKMLHINTHYFAWEYNVRLHSELLCSLCSGLS
jgi:hypothetical protein